MVWRIRQRTNLARSHDNRNSLSVIGPDVHSTIGPTFVVPVMKGKLGYPQKGDFVMGGPLAGLPVW